MTFLLCSTFFQHCISGAPAAQERIANAGRAQVKKRESLEFSFKREITYLGLISVEDWRMTRTFSAMALCAILLIAFAATAWLASLGKSATVDEPAGLVASWVQIHFGDFRMDCENPPLWRYVVAVGMPANLFRIDRASPQWESLLHNADAAGPLAAEALYRTPGVDADTLVRSARARMIGFGVLLGMVIGWWAWRLAGRVAAVVALAAFCLDPNFLGHAPLIKNDVPLALALVLFMAGVWLLGERVTIWRVLLVGLGMGVSFMVKFSGVLAVPVLAAALIARSLIPRPWPAGPLAASTVARRLALSAGIFPACLLLLWSFIWACYGFRFLPSPNSPDHFTFEDTLQYFARHAALAQSPDPWHVPPTEINDFVSRWRPPLGAKLIEMGNNLHFLPQTCLTGLLRIDAASRARVTFLCGKSSVTGWWYYFPLAMLFKTPLATLLGLAAAGAALVALFRRRLALEPWPTIAIVLMPAIYMLAAMNSNLELGIRHILPVYPFLFIFLGITAAGAWNSSNRCARWIVWLLAIGLAAETVFAFPNYIAFFNVACGGSRGGLRLLGQSNLDWGQDLPALAAWQAEHPDRQLYLLYWGSADPRYYGIRYMDLDQSTAPPDQTIPGPGRPAYAIGAVVLTDPFVRDSQKGLLDSLQDRQPIAVLNGSIYIYDAPVFGGRNVTPTDVHCSFNKSSNFPDDGGGGDAYDAITYLTRRRFSAMSSTLEIGKELVDLCRAGKNHEAMETLYDPKIVSIEPHGGPTMPARMEGLAAVKGKTEWWEKNHQVHKAEAEGPWPHGDRFIVRFKYDVTAKSGPMAGKRFTMDEAALYTVKGGKIVQEEFFYSMGG
jgi:ketosteroid isomerase-like protein/4-amino-4-deoxy-L-arabinose transferase-like glycosyltransferase